MSNQEIKPVFQNFLDRDGQPLENGYVYIGVAGKDAVANPQTVYWDAAGTIPATQPIRTSGGYLMRSGSAAKIFVGADYSITVKDRNQVVVNSALTVDKETDATDVEYISAGTGAVERTLYSRLGDSISVKDFGAVGDGSTDDTVAVTAADVYAASVGAVLSFPKGTYKMVGDYSFTAAVKMNGGSLYSSSRMTFTRGFDSEPYWSLKTQFAGIVGKVDVRWCGALGDGTGDTPTDTGDDISTALWNTWDNTLFKTSLAWSPYGGGSFVAPTGRTVPFLNTDSWDYIGANLSCWSNGGGVTYFPAGK